MSFAFFGGDKFEVREFKNDKGQIERVELVGSDGDVVERETYAYDGSGNVCRRDTFDAGGQLIEYELWSRNADGHMESHELHRADGSAVYVEKWTRNHDGKLLYAEAWLYDEAGNQTDYRKLVADERGQLVNPRRKWAVFALRTVCAVVGVGLMFVAINAYHAGNMGMAFLSGALMLLNFWNAVKKR